MNSLVGCLSPVDGKEIFVAHQHPPRFLKIVDDAKTRIRETNIGEVKARMDRGEKFLLVDVREESEFAKDHLPGAIHLGKGIIERDIEARVPALETELVLYCGGGFRSALAADDLQKMGYTNVISMDGGIRDWREKGYPLTKEGTSSQFSVINYECSHLLLVAHVGPRRISFRIRHGRDFRRRKDNSDAVGPESRTARHRHGLGALRHRGRFPARGLAR